MTAVTHAEPTGLDCLQALGIGTTSIEKYEYRNNLLIWSFGSLWINQCPCLNAIVDIENTSREALCELIQSNRIHYIIRGRCVISLREKTSSNLCKESKQAWTW